ncbi:DNA-binding response regulator [Leptospira gomenensis]|uniref:DNA-binding response regulator n=1 Tax=Leptospira gomenensis TaxID=2484974 RepID=A0A5F1YFR6_9LEPT|nr:response regulator transcription factor [Leptospira gomenensis]TGK38380.1 DNA-binding response regulator [Leptospira gomenensis]TGK39301.1 DNA-binding response regulator [Leptospira gomenensis]TGK52194.1 DNA-binding response regulator [Leptospira gomenensis]TGK62952.1 DNA-binding response regulator [Leptospira gomenensis]
MKAKLLLVEDDRSLGETLQERLQKEGYEVFWTVSAIAAKKLVKEEKPHLILLDVRLPDGDGFTLAEELKTNRDCPPFLFLTAQAGAPERLRGFELGAEEFIPKPFHLKELLLRVKHVLESHKHTLEESILRYKDYVLDFQGFQIKRGADEFPLSKRDCALLHFLVTERERTVSRSEILDKLWGEESFPTNRTIDNSIVRLRQAFGEEGDNVIRSVRGVGYQWTGEIQDVES